MHWHKHKPATQFRQYGAVDKYLNLKFPLDLVKPQNELRDEAPNQEAFKDAANTHDVKTIADELEIGDISISSFGGVVDNGTKYPDFVVASYFGSDEHGDLIAEVPRSVIEIGSLGRQLKPPTKDHKRRVISQLQGYLDQIVFLGEN
ncbi:hypothetical protein EVG20_g7435 [Dentipellis fragilis]|uniref:Uncharacterized protein n=1 Tax=Dentipellis fragilis TaxID=205917 RepID=A0A4Y9YEH2_9AGAM|nr:hypothetical protein EVG20_g7435 [Dentipellis fragilis]